MLTCVHGTVILYNVLGWTVILYNVLGFQVSDQFMTLTCVHGDYPCHFISGIYVGWGLVIRVS